MVGRVILAWGSLDQQLHQTIELLESELGIEHTAEGRFTERRKLYRRYCIRIAQDAAYERKLDSFLSNLRKLERDRGTIAHGWATDIDAQGALFRDLTIKTRISDKAQLTAANENLPAETGVTSFTFDELESLRVNIRQAMFDIPRLHAAASYLKQLQGTGPTQER